ncbi:MAG: hypothetical protein Q8S73_07625 [Deltaproteobacteria bacterium]|nr:hypothetical protein [Myxococcales bacterium]MDP3213957.1 hypothetical protein [Deltaproteobacteria bacterium]
MPTPAPLRIVSVFFVWVALAAGCASTPRAAGCRSRAGLHCLTPVECTVDRRSGCEVCRCADPGFVPIGAPGDRGRDAVR